TGESVAGQVHEARSFAEVEEVDGLRPSRRLAGEREAPAAEEGIDGARLADVGSAGERDFGRPGWRQVRRAAARGEERGVRERPHRVPKGANSNKIAPFAGRGIANCFEHWHAHLARL